MKKYILSGFVLFLFNTPIFSQHYFPKDSAEWKVYYQRTEGPITHKDFINHSYTKDTVLMGNQYMKIISGHALFLSSEAYLREDSSAQKVYMLRNKCRTLADHLLYDFSKSVGDTILIPTCPYGTADTTKWYVFNEGQITIDQQQRRYMELEFVGINHFQHGDSIYMDRWIEGIGSVRGLFAPFLDDGSIGIGESLRYHLVCFSDKGKGVQYEPKLLKDSTFYETHLYTYYDSVSNCNTIPWNNISMEETVNYSALVKTYPNPFREQLILDNPTSERYGFSLIMASGRIAMHGTIKEFERHVLDTGHLPEGMYLLKVEMEDQVWSTTIFCQ